VCLQSRVDFVFISRRNLRSGDWDITQYCDCDVFFISLCLCYVCSVKESCLVLSLSAGSALLLRDVLHTALHRTRDAAPATDPIAALHDIGVYKLALEEVEYLLGRRADINVWSNKPTSTVFGLSSHSSWVQTTYSRQQLTMLKSNDSRMSCVCLCVRYAASPCWLLGHVKNEE